MGRALEDNRMTCAWCGRPFTPRCDGGKRQRFCREVCRRIFDAAGRRWVAGRSAPEL